MAQTKSSFWRNTQNFFLIFGSPNARLITKVRNELDEIQNNTIYELTSINQSNINSPKQLRKALLKDAKQLRINNRPELSLKIIETARNHGITSPQLEAGRAKSLTALNEHEKAIQIWQKQSLCDKPKIKDEANNAIQIYERNHQLATELLQELLGALDSAKMVPKHLPEIPPLDLAKLERSIINEAIELRKKNKNELSLNILEISIYAGLNNDLIYDNKARVLFNMGRKRDAVHIWQTLLSSKNKKVNDSSQKTLKRLSLSLLHSLKKCITEKNQSIHYLPEDTPQDLSKLGISILKEAIELRKENQNNLSLQILEMTTSAGFETDAINENRARVLINLNRKGDAVKLLEELQSSKKEAIQRSATKMLTVLGDNLIKDLNKILVTSGWTTRHLPEKNIQQPIHKLENITLKEAIELRKDDNNELSLKVLDFIIKSGLRSDRIDDNKARAFVNMERYADAVTIWHSLTDSKNEKIQKTANLMLERFGAKGLQQQILIEVDNALRCENDQKKAINILTDAILQSPTDQKIRDKLGQVALMSNNKNDSIDEEFEELSTRRQSLAGFDALITTLEQQQHRAALQGTSETKETKNKTELNIQ
jgi:hypothetical protein